MGNAEHERIIREFFGKKLEKQYGLDIDKLAQNKLKKIKTRIDKKLMSNLYGGTPPKYTDEWDGIYSETDSRFILLEFEKSSSFEFEKHLLRLLNILVNNQRIDLKVYFVVGDYKSKDGKKNFKGKDTAYVGWVHFNEYYKRLFSEIKKEEFLHGIIFYYYDGKDFEDLTDYIKKREEEN